MGARDALQRRKLAEEGGVVADARLLVGRGRPVALGAGSVVLELWEGCIALQTTGSAREWGLEREV